MQVQKLKGKVPIKSWCNNVDPKAMEQAYNLASLPFAHSHIALMPDAHCGYGMPIGGVLATIDVVIPYAVGYDIGCRMSAVKTNLTVSEWEECHDGWWQHIVEQIRIAIPMGRNHQTEPISYSLMPKLKDPTDPEEGILTVEEWSAARYQLGTLGGGNHFIEFQAGDDGFIWIMIHSGSRNVGKRVCEFHHKVAQDLNEKWKSGVPKAWQLAFLPVDSTEGVCYLREMLWCMEFAKASHEHMMCTILDILETDIPNFEAHQSVSIAHNFVAHENHFGKNVWVHRKGATPAREKQLGIIPGTQGTSSYIVEGLGNPQSFQSCSHGAGRPMSRTDAKNKLDLATEQKRMDGIIHTLRSQGGLDEAPGAYKDIKSVMAQQTDLVRPVVKLLPLVSIKPLKG